MTNESSVYLGTPISFELNFDWQSERLAMNNRGWSISGEYWTEVTDTGDNVFKLEASLVAP